MTLSNVRQAVETLAHDLSTLPDAALDRPWAWQSYDSEGVRFGLFRTFEDLRDLAARLQHVRAAGPHPLSEAQRILGQYHSAYRDLQAALIGITTEQMTQPPSEGEWPVGEALPHMTGADVGFYVVIAFALQQRRAGNIQPMPLTEEAWTEWVGMEDAAYEVLMKSPTARLLTYFEMHHARVLDAFAPLSADELDWPSLYWEDEPYPLRFRLHRFESHLRQHTLQVDKTLLSIGQPPSETRRLLRLIYNALAEVEAALIGMPGGASSTDMLLNETARSIAARSAELTAIATGPAW